MRECVAYVPSRTFPGSDADTYLLLLRDEHADVGVGGGRLRHAVAEQTHLVLPQRRGVRAGRRHRLTRPSEYDECCRSCEYFSETAGERTELARAGLGEPRKRTGRSVDCNPIHFNRAAKGRSSLQKITNDRRSLSRNAPQEGAFGSLSRDVGPRTSPARRVPTRTRRTFTPRAHTSPPPHSHARTPGRRAHARDPRRLFLARPRI